MIKITIFTETHCCSFDVEEIITWHPVDLRSPTVTGRPSVHQGQVTDMYFSDDGGSTRYAFPRIDYRPPLWERIKAVFR